MSKKILIADRGDQQTTGLRSGEATAPRTRYVPVDRAAEH
jgi:hypothetical protein